MGRRLQVAALLLVVAADQLNLIYGQGSCPEVTCPEGCEKETPVPEHRCPWCVCHPIAARKTLEKFAQRHCPKQLVEFVQERSEDLKGRVFKFSDEVRQQKVVLKNFRKLHVPHVDGGTDKPEPCPTPICAPNCTIVVGDHGCPDCECPTTHCPRKKCPPKCHRETGVLHNRCPECVCEADIRTVKPLDCPTPMCARNCTLITGDGGCPECECPPTHCPRKKCPPNCHREETVTGNRCPECVCDGDTGGHIGPSGHRGRKESVKDKSSEESSEEKAGAPQRRQKRDKRKGDDSSEESSEESSEDKREGRDSSEEEIRTRLLRRSRGKRHHHLGTYGRKNSTLLHRRTGHVQCTPPLCEPYCSTKPGPHGCLVCNCPDICPDIVCGIGCHPEHTEHHKCERCVCNPEIERQALADAFYSHCGEGSLRTLLIEFVNLKKTLDFLEQQVKEHDEEISKIETLHGITVEAASTRVEPHAPLGVDQGRHPPHTPHHDHHEGHHHDHDHHGRR